MADIASGAGCVCGCQGFCNYGRVLEKRLPAFTLRRPQISFLCIFLVLLYLNTIVTRFSIIQLGVLSTLKSCSWLSFSILYTACFHGAHFLPSVSPVFLPYTLLPAFETDILLLCLCLTVFFYSFILLDTVVYSIFNEGMPGILLYLLSTSCSCPKQ